jgi:hypothetical protein
LLEADQDASHEEGDFDQQRSSQLSVSQHHGNW